MINSEILKECPVCGSSNFINEKIEAPGYQYGINDLSSYCECNECKVLFQNPRIDPDYISIYYDNNYYTRSDLCNSNVSKTRKTFYNFIQRVKIIKWKSQALFDYRFPKNKGRLLDYGAGSGHLLNMLKHNDWKDLWWYDTDSEALKVENINKLYDKDIFPLDSSLENTFDYIISNHSLEHIANPIEVLKLWHSLLKPGGELIVATPNLNSIFFKVFKSFWYFLTPPYHYIIYTPKSLEMALKKTGFEMKSVEFHSNSQCLWGSLDLLIQKNRIGSSTPVSMYLNNSSLLSILTKPLIYVFDVFGLGDNLVLKMTKSSR